MVNMHCSTGYSLMTRLSRKLESIWYTSKKPNVVLRLLALCFGLLSGVRKQLYSLAVAPGRTAGRRVCRLDNVSTGAGKRTGHVSGHILALVSRTALLHTRCCSHRLRLQPGINIQAGCRPLFWGRLISQTAIKTPCNTRNGMAISNNPFQSNAANTAPALSAAVACEPNTIRSLSP